MFAGILSNISCHTPFDGVCVANFVCSLTFGKNLLMINLVKKLFASISSLFTYLFFVLPAFAVVQETPIVKVDPCEGTGNTIADMLCKLGGENVGNTIRNIVVFFVILAVIFALIYLLYGGIKWITSRGDKTEVEAARNHIIAAVVGLIVVILAVFILSIILGAFGINFNDLKIPVISSGAKVSVPSNLNK